MLQKDLTITDSQDDNIVEQINRSISLNELIEFCGFDNYLGTDNEQTNELQTKISGQTDIWED